MNEVHQDRSPFIPRFDRNSSSARSGNGPGYKSPISSFERFRRRMRTALSSLAGPALIPGQSGIEESLVLPQEWRDILLYLYDYGCLAFPNVVIEPLFHDLPKLFSLRLVADLRKDQTDGSSQKTRFSRGISYDFHEAMSKVIGEFLERYPQMLYQRKKQLRASVSTLERSHTPYLNILDAAGFSDQQKENFPNRRFDEKTQFHWVKGKELTSEKDALIPAQFVYWNYRAEDEPEEPYLRYPSSNGSAGHFTRTKAVIAGIYENIQRDAFLIRWLNQLIPNRIDPHSVSDPKLLRIISDVERYNFDTILLDTSLDIDIPSTACILMNKSDVGHRIAVGGGCAGDLASSLLGSITEAVGVYHWMQASGETYSLPKDYKPFTDDSVDQGRRLFLWSDPLMLPYLQPFLSGKVIEFNKAEEKYGRAFKTDDEELRHLVKKFKDLGKGYEIYVYEIEHEVLQKLSYFSVKTIIPRLIPIYVREAGAPLGAERLRQFAPGGGFSPYPWPHPFP